MAKLPVSAGFGAGDYRAALRDLERKLPFGSVAGNLRADEQLTAILGVYRRQCLVLEADVFVTASQPPPS